MQNYVAAEGVRDETGERTKCLAFLQFAKCLLSATFTEKHCTRCFKQCQIQRPWKKTAAYEFTVDAKATNFPGKRQIHHPRLANSTAASPQNHEWDPSACKALNDNPNVAETVDLHMINFLMKNHGCEVQHYSPSYLKFMALMQCFVRQDSPCEQLSIENLFEKLSLDEENQSRVFRFDLNDFQIPILTLKEAHGVVCLQNVLAETIEVSARASIFQHVRSKVASLLGKRTRCVCIVQLRDTESNLRRWVVDLSVKPGKKQAPEIFVYGYTNVEAWWRRRREGKNSAKQAGAIFTDPTRDAALSFLASPNSSFDFIDIFALVAHPAPTEWVLTRFCTELVYSGLTNHMSFREVGGRLCHLKKDFAHLLAAKPGHGFQLESLNLRH